MLWRTFTISDGLSAGVVQVIAEDNQRRVWIGTSAGVSIWNGASFFRLDRQSGLPNDDITALFSDGPRMWIGTNAVSYTHLTENPTQRAQNQRDAGAQHKVERAHPKEHTQPGNFAQCSRVDKKCQNDHNNGKQDRKDRGRFEEAA